MTLRLWGLTPDYADEWFARGVSDDALILLIEGIHAAPGERHASFQRGGISGQRGVPPCGMVGRAIHHLDREPGDGAQFRVLGGAVLGEQSAGFNVAVREVCDRVAAGSCSSTTSSLSAIHWSANRTRIRRRSGSA